MKIRGDLSILLSLIISVPVFAPAPVLAQAAQSLTLKEAEAIAIQNHPKVQVAVSLATAAEAQVTQARSANYPLIFGSLTGVAAEKDSRVAAGSLSNPIIYDRYANGISVSQLLTDFGRTQELVKSSNLHAKAQQENVATSRADVLLQVDQAYFAALRAQALLTVAEQTVQERQLVADQVKELEKNKIKSGLDVSFANVALQQGQLLLIQAQNDLLASFADLSAALGYSSQQTFRLSEEPLPSAPSSDVTSLIEQSLRDRPELIGQRSEATSAQRFAKAQSNLWFPTVSAFATAGLVPLREDPVSSRYFAVGLNVNIPIFNGFLFNSLKKEADSRAHAEEERVRELQDRITREVVKAWLGANSAYQRLAVTDQLLKQANLALDLAQSRYRLGLSSIVELSQAQLNQTQAQIEEASAKYDYAAQFAALNYQLGTFR
ncbi:MAG TPA: TolC family protein [Candidatus Manganitrophaceae bacterium]|nr:TolC family protein [Candidatus Manganitrophaceae bacterium]